MKGLGFALAVAAVSLMVVTGCGDDGEKECLVGTGEGCGEGLVCAAVQGEEKPACFGPLLLAGTVFDGLTKEPVDEAAIVVVDANGTPLTSVVRSGEDGGWSVAIASERKADGTPLSRSVTLRVSAAGYEPFPTPPRVSIPVDLAAAEEVAGPVFRLENAALDVHLTPLPESGTDLFTLSGRVDAEAAGGILMVAVQDGAAVSRGFTDAGGFFLLFNVPAGTTEVTGFRQFLIVPSLTVEVGDPPPSELLLTADSCTCATVSGSVSMVNAPGDAVTSVILAPEAAFDESSRRGEAPPGFRAAEVTGAFAIDGIPPGKYVVLAAFENDGLVLDPDLSIAGTDIVHLAVAADQAAVEIGEPFKVTEALAVVRPGSDGPEEIDAAPVELEWADDSSEKGYVVRVYDSYGNLLHEDEEVPLVTGSETVSYTWTPAAALEDGMYYQFRAWSWKEDKKEGRVYISSTEDLLGVFRYVEPAEEEAE